MSIAVLQKMANPPPYRSDRVILFVDLNGVVWQRGSDGLFRLTSEADLTDLLADVAVLQTDLTALQVEVDGKEAVDAQSYVLGTSVSASGTAIDFTGIPSGTKVIHITMAGLSMSGTAEPQVQIGDAGGVETTGYVAASSALRSPDQQAAGSTSTTAFSLFAGFGLSATTVYSGIATLVLVDPATNLWAFSATLGGPNGVGTGQAGGHKPLSATLDRVRVGSSNGTDTFDAGTINIAYKR